MVGACNPSPQEVGAEGSQSQGHLWLPSKFNASLGYHPVLKNKQGVVICAFNPGTQETEAGRPL